MKARYIGETKDDINLINGKFYDISPKIDVIGKAEIILAALHDLPIPNCIRVTLNTGTKEITKTFLSMNAFLEEWEILYNYEKEKEPKKEVKKEFTVTDMRKLFDNRIQWSKNKNNGGSAPQPLFSNIVISSLIPLQFEDVSIGEDYEELYKYEFVSDNWNSGQDIVRYIGLHIWDSAKTSYKFIVNDTNVGKCEVTIRICYKEDDWMIIIETISEKEGYDIYIESWYKSRGRTDMISKNNQRITLTEYLDLVNLLMKDEMIYQFIVDDILK